MPTQEQLTSLSKLMSRLDAFHADVRYSEDLVLKEEREIVAGFLEELALHVKQLQLEVVKLAELHNKLTR